MHFKHTSTLFWTNIITGQTFSRSEVTYKIIYRRPINLLSHLAAQQGTMLLRCPAGLLCLDHVSSSSRPPEVLRWVRFVTWQQS